MKQQVPILNSSAAIADTLGVSLARVQYILRTRAEIRPQARVGRVFVYDRSAVAAVKAALGEIDAARRSPAPTVASAHAARAARLKSEIAFVEGRRGKGKATPDGEGGGNA